MKITARRKLFQDSVHHSCSRPDGSGDGRAVPSRNQRVGAG
jgi:hypothetical protein